MSIQVNNLCFSYGKRLVLEGITFHAEEGDLLCVLGPNGVGKSTLFRCMLGLQKQDTGEILLDGDDIKKLSPAKLAKRIAYIPQYGTPVFNYSVFHTVLMGTTPLIGSLASPGKKQEQAVREVLEQFGIAHLSDRGCAQISGGERQLALIARAVVQQAKILVLDEPAANLDYGNQVRVMGRLKQLTSQGYTVILSTHNPEHALLYANRVMVLMDGKLLKWGSPETVIEESLLRQIYRVNVRLETVEIGGRNVRVCIPEDSLAL